MIKKVMIRVNLLDVSIFLTSTTAKSGLLHINIIIEMKMIIPMGIIKFEFTNNVFNIFKN
jgi:hypothetical protein